MTRRRLAATVAVTGALVVAVVIGVLATRNWEGKPAPVATAPAEAGGFRGGALPAGIDGEPAPVFQLRDARGGMFDVRELRGRPYLVTFLFANCPDVCPLIGEELRRALELLGPRAREVSALAVSVDPKGDTPVAVRRFLADHRLPRNFHYLIGSRGQLAPVWESYFVGPQEAGSKESRHTANIWLVDRRGRWRTKFSAGVAVSPRDVAHDLGLLLRERAGA